MNLAKILQKEKKYHLEHLTEKKEKIILLQLKHRNNAVPNF